MSWLFRDLLWRLVIYLLFTIPESGPPQSYYESMIVYCKFDWIFSKIKICSNLYVSIHNILVNRILFWENTLIIATLSLLVRLANLRSFVLLSFAILPQLWLSWQLKTLWRPNYTSHGDVLGDTLNWLPTKENLIIIFYWRGCKILPAIFDTSTSALTVHILYEYTTWILQSVNLYKPLNAGALCEV